MNIYKSISDVCEPAVSDGQLYIYVIENYPQGNIKIGKSSNVKRRFQSLSGSNGGGNRLVKFAVSPVTYLYSLEVTMHTHFHQFRIKGTEWFDGTKITFDEVVAYLDSLLSQSSYERCNEIRKNFITSHNNFHKTEFEDAALDDLI